LDGHELDYDTVWEHNQSYITPAGTLSTAMSEAIQDCFGITPELSTTGGTSDGRFITDIASEVIEFGPLNKTILWAWH